MQQMTVKRANPERPVRSLFYKSEMQFRHLLETLPAAYTCNAKGFITYYNRRAVELWGRAPKLNKSSDRFCGSFKLFSKDGKAISHDQCWMALALKTNKKFNGREIIIERPNGERLTALAHANPIRNSAGKVLGAVNVLIDITEQRRVKEELHHAKNEFLAMLSHELRNSLAPMGNALQILQLKATPSTELQWALGAIDRQIQYMTRLVNDLIDMARITSNKLEPQKEFVELGQVLHPAVETSGPLMTKSYLPILKNPKVLSASSLHILVVDDNRDSATSLSMLLQLLGNDVHTAYDGLEAIQIIQKFQPQVILLDIGLPKIGGYEVARWIQQQNWNNEILLIALTGLGQEADKLRSKEAGFHHHLVKPVDPTALIGLLSSFKNTLDDKKQP